MNTAIYSKIVLFFYYQTQGFKFDPDRKHLNTLLQYKIKQVFFPLSMFVLIFNVDPLKHKLPSAEAISKAPFFSTFFSIKILNQQLVYLFHKSVTCVCFNQSPPEQLKAFVSLRVMGTLIIFFQVT